jgi:hypothetical protein
MDVIKSSMDFLKGTQIATEAEENPSKLSTQAPPGEPSKLSEAFLPAITNQISTSRQVSVPEYIKPIDRVATDASHTSKFLDLYLQLQRDDGTEKLDEDPDEVVIDGTPSHHEHIGQLNNASSTISSQTHPTKHDIMTLIDTPVIEANLPQPIVGKQLCCCETDEKIFKGLSNSIWAGSRDDTGGNFNLSSENVQHDNPKFNKLSNAKQALTLTPRTNAIVKPTTIATMDHAGMLNTPLISASSNIQLTETDGNKPCSGRFKRGSGLDGSRWAS